MSKPIGAYATIIFDDRSAENSDAYISFGEMVFENDDIKGDEFGVADSRIFFYGRLEDEIAYREGIEGWILMGWELVTQ